jgi:Putative zinc-finger
MEGPALRSVPLRLPGPVDPVHALALVEGTLPDLDEVAQRAFALVDLGGRARTEATTELGVAEPELARLLALARKGLRRTLAALPSDGWCERAELLISDRLDHALTPRGRARLDAHLTGCERCETHERELARAHAGLVESYLAAHAPAPRPMAVRPAELRLVEEPPAPAGRRNIAVGIRVALAIVLLIVVALVSLAAAGILHL